ncbi:MAG: aldo/keto reductase [Spirochaetaceae bacterium]|nr:MAG: aldo/keto reductase [Spirochaetaceae bacterium]
MAAGPAPVKVAVNAVTVYDGCMETRTLGRTDLVVSRLGVGLSEVGFELTSADVDRAAAVLNAALDAGITFLDTAACYNVSEELLGKAVSHRRSEFVLATKCGHVAGGYEGESWTRATVRDSIDRSLERMRTDHLDLVQLHSCGVDVLERSGVIDELERARDAGKTRFIGYSGDNDAALFAVRTGRFDTLQTSFNPTDQKARYELFGEARARSMGIIAKRPIANGAWRAESSPSDYASEYFTRYRAMAGDGALAGEPDDRIALALGFTLAHEEVDVAIVGTKNAAHMRSNIELVSAGLSIDPSLLTELHSRFDRLGADWPQMT